MLTARAEYRLRLRANNAVTRLTPVAQAVGCLGPERQAWFAAREDQRARWSATLTRSVASSELATAGVPVKRDAGRMTLAEWLRFPGIDLAALSPVLADDLDIGSDLAAEMAEDAFYAPYLERQDGELRDLRASEAVPLGERFPYAQVPGLSNEMVERLSSARPPTLAAAGLIRGITPAALAALLVHARKVANRD